MLSFVLDFFKKSFIPPQREMRKIGEKSKRIEYIDLAKGVCIILVVLLHLSVPEPLNFRALRMPLYFVLSGLFFKTYEPKVFIFKKINNIIIPFIFWLVLFSIWYIYHNRIGLSNLVQIIIEDHGLLFGITNWIDCVNAPIWFLFALFTTSLLFYLLSFINIKDTKTIFFLCIIMALLSYALYVNDITTPLWIASSFAAMPFYFLGYFIQRHNFLNKINSIPKRLILAAILLSIGYFIYYIGDYPHSILHEFIFNGNFILIYINSYAMVIGILLLCSVIKWLPVVSYFGRYSLVVLCIHAPISIYIPQFIEKYIGYDITMSLHVIITLALCWIAIPICTKVLPYFVAQKNIFETLSKNQSIQRQSLFAPEKK